MPFFLNKRIAFVQPNSTLSKKNTKVMSNIVSSFELISRPVEVEKYFRFSPLSFSWVALHPCPKGVIQFIGGAFFGSFPTFFYEYLLKQLFLEGYTIIALPFRFTFSHWPVAISLLREQQELRPLLAELAQHLGYDSEIYSHSESYSWVGHSLGCKYIALLELLADWNNEQNKTRSSIEQYGKRPRYQLQAIERNIKDIKISIKNQASLLLAPDISDTKDAIKLPFLPELLDHFGLGVLPTKKGTFKFIQDSSLFNLAAMISFDHDNIAGNLESVSGLDNTVLSLIKILAPKLLNKEIKGAHLRPIGIELADSVLGPISPSPRELVPLAIKFLQQLKQRLEGTPAPVVPIQEEVKV